MAADEDNLIGAQYAYLALVLAHAHHRKPGAHGRHDGVFDPLGALTENAGRQGCEVVSEVGHGSSEPSMIWDLLAPALALVALVYALGLAGWLMDAWEWLSGSE